MRALFAVILFSTTLIASNTSSLPQLPANQVVARVNGVELRGATLNDYVSAVIPDFSFHGKVQPDKLNDYRRAALDRMVLHELIYEEGIRRHTVVPSARVDAEIALMQGRFRSADAFQRALSARGLTLAELRAHIERSLVIAAVVRQDVTSRAKVTEAEAHAYYRKNLERFREPATIHVRHIFIPSGPGGRQQADEVRSMAAAKNTSEEFGQLATRYSKDDYRVMGGDLGWVHRGRLEPELEKAAFALHAGELSPTIESKTGFHIVRVEGKHPAQLIPFAQVRKKIHAQLLDAKRDQLREAMRARVSKNAKVELLAKF